MFEKDLLSDCCLRLLSSRQTNRMLWIKAVVKCLKKRGNAKKLSKSYNIRLYRCLNCVENDAAGLLNMANILKNIYVKLRL